MDKYKNELFDASDVNTTRIKIGKIEMIGKKSLCEKILSSQTSFGTKFLKIFGL